MPERRLMNIFKHEFYEMLGSLSIIELTQNKRLPEVLERISLILSAPEWR